MSGEIDILTSREAVLKSHAAREALPAPRGPRYAMRKTNKEVIQCPTGMGLS